MSMQSLVIQEQALQREIDELALITEAAPPVVTPPAPDGAAIEAKAKPEREALAAKQAADEKKAAAANIKMLGQVLRADQGLSHGAANSLARRQAAQ